MTDPFIPSDHGENMEYPHIQQLIDEGKYKPKFQCDPWINVADLVSPKSGLTYREENAKKEHKIPIGSLVEHIETRIRLFVVFHGRDCDQSPLYSLSPDQEDIEVETQGFSNCSWHNGYSEESLKIIKLPTRKTE